MHLETIALSSLSKVFPNKISGEKITKLTAFGNEPVSFQIAFRTFDEDKETSPLFVRVESNLETDYISEYIVGYVPVINSSTMHANGYNACDNCGIYPDLLLKRKVNAKTDTIIGWKNQCFEQDQENTITTTFGTYQSLWYTVNENGDDIKAGNYEIKISFYDTVNSEFVGSETVAIDVMPEMLPKQELLYTNWFHCDCLADTYGVDIFSDKHFEIIKSFVKEAAKTGMNMILLPAFTPPLDTPVGKERKTVQLVNVTKIGDNYTFDFSLMKRFISLCRECGIHKFEHNHMFTQWGARFAPKIMVTENGEYKKIFGWETDATDSKYQLFLEQYFTALKEFFGEIGIKKEDILFHISDEPAEKSFEYYKNACKIMTKSLDGYTFGDAISNYSFFENGSCTLPIVIISSNEIQRFADNCDNYWVYYTGAVVGDNYSNRLITTPSEMNRIIGIEMYANNAKGFLHWGFNYYYDLLSQGVFNPMCIPGGYRQNPGSSYMVYPKTDGTAIPSIRMKIFYEGINDYRALCLLESKIGKEKTLEFINSTVGKISYTSVLSREEIFDFRLKLFDRICYEK